MSKNTPLLNLFLPRLDALLFIVLFLSALTLGPRMLNIDGDLPRHLLMGKVVLETGAVPTHEIFAYPYEARPYVPHEWLAGVVYYIAFLLLGLNGVVLLAGILIAGTFGGIYHEALRNHAGKVLPFALILLGALVTSIHWVARPHLFTMFFLAIWLILIDRLNHGIPVKLWIFATFILLWANIHAEFIAGFLVLLAYLGGWLWQYAFGKSKPTVETAKKLIVLTIGSFLVSLLNPSGLRVWDTVFGYLNNRYLMSRIIETRPPDFARPEYWPLLLLLGISVLLLMLRKDKLSSAHVFLMLGFGAMSLVSARNAHLFGVVAPSVLCSSLQYGQSAGWIRKIEESIDRIQGQANGYLWPLAFTIVLSIFALSWPLRTFNRFEPTVFPVDAVQWLEDHPQPGRMFNAFDWGGYILFHLWPEQQMFIESQTDTSGEVTQMYEDIITLQSNWMTIFKRYNITWVIIPPNWNLGNELIKQGWETAYHDSTAVILVQR